VHEIAARRAIRQLSAADSPATGRPDLSIKRLGVARIDSPLAALLNTRQTSEHYVDESDRVILDDTLSMIQARDGSVDKLPSFEPAGPRRKIFFDPSMTRPGSSPAAGCAPGSTTSSVAWSAT
jgi:6-phosphofructokinase 1